MTLTVTVSANDLALSSAVLGSQLVNLASHLVESTDLANMPLLAAVSAGHLLTIRTILSSLVFLLDSTWRPGF